jgi:hypothetical protein
MKRPAASPSLAVVYKKPTVDGEPNVGAVHDAGTQDIPAAQLGL